MIKKTSLALLLASLTIAACKDQSDFDPKKWKADTGCPSHESDRQRMIGNLEEAYLRSRMREQEVIDLLGEPEERRDVTFIYCLGRALIDYDSFHITFDGEGVVKSFRIDPG